MRLPIALVTGVGVLVAGGCGDPPKSGTHTQAPTPPPASDQATTPDPASSPLNEGAILASIANGAYRYSAQFTPVNHTPFPSAVAPSNINVWVTSADFGAYASIAPEASGSGAKLTPGAMIVREVLGADGLPIKLTLMVKGPPGYNDALGDFWFAVTEPNGTPLEDNGQKLTGKLSQCFGCHVPRASDGYLFGVPRSARGAGDADDAGAVGAPDAEAPPPPTPGQVCGDFYCGIGESCVTCSVDCGPCEDHGGDDDDGSGGGGSDNSGEGSSGSGSGKGSGKG